MKAAAKVSMGKGRTRLASPGPPRKPPCDVPEPSERSRHTCGTANIRVDGESLESHSREMCPGVCSELGLPNEIRALIVRRAMKRRWQVTLVSDRNLRRVTFAGRSDFGDSQFVQVCDHALPGEDQSGSAASASAQIQLPDVAARPKLS